MSSYVVRVWLPDRPGALGQVASRIGGVRGDVVGIEILERGGGSAVDELVVSLPDDISTDLLISEISQVDGVAIEDLRSIDSDRPDAGMVALGIAAQLVETPPEKCLEVFCEQLLRLVDGSWSVALRGADGQSLVEYGDPPDTTWLAAFFAGSRHIASGDHHDGTPGDVVWVHLDSIDASVAAGRGDRPFHSRERQQVALLGRVVDGLIAAALHSA